MKTCGGTLFGKPSGYSLSIIALPDRLGTGAGQVVLHIVRIIMNFSDTFYLTMRAKDEIKQGTAHML
jgi:hypothetical protein